MSELKNENTYVVEDSDNYNKMKESFDTLLSNLSNVKSQIKVYNFNDP